MYVATERYEIEYVFIMRAKSTEERQVEMSKYIEQGYEVDGLQEIDYVSGTEYNAKLKKFVKKIG